MNEKDRTTLKSYFETGDRPTEDQFSQLIDSFINKVDDNVHISETKDVGIGIDDPQAKLHVNGSLRLESGVAVRGVSEELGQSQDYIATEHAIRTYLDELLVGMVAAFAMETPPDGWLLCDGRAVERDKYARLFDRIGSTYGSGDGNTTFNLPDLRGEFVRGWDRSRGADPDADQRRDFAGNIVGDQVGSLQDARMQSHRHIDAGHSHSDAGHSHSDSGHSHASPSHSHTETKVEYVNSGGAGTLVQPVFNPTSFYWHNVARSTGSAGVTINTASANIGSASASINSASANIGDPRTSGSAGSSPVQHGIETRPRNMALLYCIKF